MIGRHHLLAAAGRVPNLALLPLLSQAQAVPKHARIGVLFPGTQVSWVDQLGVVRRALNELGCVDGNCRVRRNFYRGQKSTAVYFSSTLMPSASIVMSPIS
jgi:hypothetical protein